MRTLFSFALIAILPAACGGPSSGEPFPLSGDSLLSMHKKPEAPPQDAPMQAPDWVANYEATASTAEELLNEVQPGVLLGLSPGDYDLGALASKQYGGWIRWKHIAGGKEQAKKQPLMLVWEGLNNVQIRAQGGKAVWRNQRDGAAICVFYNCNNLSLEGIHFQNLCNPDQSAGGALVFINCKNVFVRNCQTTGFNAFAIEAYDCDHLHVYKSTFRACHQHVLRLERCNDVYFCNNELLNNTPKSNLLEIRTSNRLVFDNLYIHNNRYRNEQKESTALLYALESKSIHLKNSRLRGNDWTSLYNMFGGEGPRVDGITEEDETGSK